MEQKMAEKNNLAQKEEMEIVSFKLDEKEYGLKIEYVKEVIRFKKITRVPGAPPFIRGVINLRGNIVPVIDLRYKLLDERTQSENVEIMISIHEGSFFGIMVDDVQEVIRLNLDDIEKVEASETKDKSRVIEGIGKLDKRLISILRVRELLDWSGAGMAEAG
jgi:purine-binding chemotaxis protein CheW